MGSHAHLLASTCHMLLREGEGMANLNTITSINTNMGEISINMKIDASVKNSVSNMCTGCSFCCLGNNNTDAGTNPDLVSNSNVDFSVGLSNPKTPSSRFGSNWPFH